MMRNIFIVAAGGAIGSVMRYLITILISRLHGSVFPFATLAINISGCFLIGLFAALLDKNALVGSGWKWFLITGLCGGYTTFSAFGQENVSLMQHGNAALAFLYIAASIIGGLAAVWAGLMLVR